MKQTETEMIVWHRYPECKPNEIGQYLVQTDSDHIRRSVWNGETFVEIENPEYYGDFIYHVVAFSEMPKGIE